MHECSLGYAATMLYKVDLKETGLDVFPVGKGADRNLFAQRRVVHAAALTPL